MPFIQNIAMMDLCDGFHRDPGDNSVLIQIMDNDCLNFPTPKVKFREIHKFNFLDVEESTYVLHEDMRFSDWQAKQIANILRKALEDGFNVIVHCHAGVCRSGAVCEVGVMMGFEDTRRYRNPNLLVKRKLIKEIFGEQYSHNADIA